PPVPRRQEITMLASRFPDNIRLYTSSSGGELLGGTVVYFTDTVAKAQYIAASPEGKRLKVLPQLFSWIISNHCGNRRYFDFGTSNDDHGQYLNEGLIRQKNGMGGRGVAYNVYRIPVVI
nr:GNAT family N-acetyltransferase [Muribaculaceae bacterium]